jgi:hypothetical protein
MNLYSTEIRICATLYVKANSPEEALEKAAKFATDAPFEFEGQEVSDKGYDDPSLPEISLSPAMSGHGLWDREDASLDLVEENLPEPVTA